MVSETGFTVCLPKSADSVMDRMKNPPNVLKCTRKAQVHFTSRHDVPYLADLATVFKHYFLNVWFFLLFLGV